MDSALRKRPPQDVDPANIVSGPRAKRARPSYAEQDPEEDMMDTDAFRPNNFMEMGFKLLNSVKEVHDPASGKNISAEFIRLPPKKLYPDYYKVIKRPIAIDTVRNKLEQNSYVSLQEVKDDLLLIFRNAKQYNMKESYIYNSARTLQRIVAAEYKQITGIDEEILPSDQENAVATAKRDLLEQTLLQTTEKLCSLKDEEGNSLTFWFMDLPDKKLYPSYYTFIKKPICFNQILAKIKSHDYITASEWAADIELLFKNAFTFNEDTSPVCVHARALQAQYRTYIAEFPPELGLERPVVKGKVGRPRKTMEVKAEPTPPPQAPPVMTLRTRPPAPSPAAAEPVRQPLLATPAKPSPVPRIPPGVTVTPMSGIKPPLVSTPTAGTPTPAGMPTRSGSAFHGQGQRPPVPSFNQPQQRHAASQPLSLPPGPPIQSSFALGPNAPLPDGIPRNPMTYVTLKTLPAGRIIYLDAQDGVTVWSIRLAGGKLETGVFIDSIEVEEPEERSSSDDDASDHVPQKRKPGRPSTRAAANGNGAGKKGTVDNIGEEYLNELEVKLNGKPIDQDDEGGYTVDLNPGGSVLDIGGWRVFLDRD